MNEATVQPPVLQKLRNPFGVPLVALAPLERLQWLRVSQQQQLKDRILEHVPWCRNSYGRLTPRQCLFEDQVRNSDGLEELAG